jgi:AGCS family alanine or glycine:cation symporter
VGGGLVGSMTASILNAMQSGVARGCFSNEAGMGSAAITAAAATTDNHVRQGYINSTGTFWDTLVVCTITGLAIVSSGVLGTTNADGSLLSGPSLTIAAFRTVLGPVGAWLVAIALFLFAFSTILGWEYHGEKALEYLTRSTKATMVYRILFSAVAFVGCVTAFGVAMNISDILNALMVVPNAICMWLLVGPLVKDMEAFELVKKAEKEAKVAPAVDRVEA